MKQTILNSSMQLPSTIQAVSFKALYNKPDNKKSEPFDPNSFIFDTTFDNLLTRVANEIDCQYNNNTKEEKLNENEAKKKSDDLYKHIDITFVPKSNYINKAKDKFTYHSLLGQGASCRVCLVSDFKTGKHYAMKQMNRSHPKNRLFFANEYQILTKLKHPNIVSLESCWMSPQYFYLNTKYCSGGTMLARIIKQGNFSEAQCAAFIQSVLCGLQYMHSQNIVHRDIKCENLVFDKIGNKGKVKIIDFGSSEIITNPNEIDNKFIGSLHYLPPELLLNSQRTKGSLYKGDMWALGIVCYILVSGQLPFSGTTQQDTIAAIKCGQFKWPTNVILSDSCKHFISSLLSLNVEQRLNCSAALEHEWIAKKGKASKKHFGNDYITQIEMFACANKLQKVLIQTILSEMDKKEKYLLLKAFRDLSLKADTEVNQMDLVNYILMYSNTNHHQKMDSNWSFPRTPKVGDANHSSYSFNDEINIDAVLDAIEDEPLATNVFVSNQSESVMDSKNENGELVTVNQYSDEEDDDKYDDEGQSQESYSDHEAVEMIKLSVCRFSAFNSSPMSDHDTDSDEFPSTSLPQKISTERFKEILSKAPESYDVEHLIDNLDPTNSGAINLITIEKYNDSLHYIPANKSHPFN